MKNKCFGCLNLRILFANSLYGAFRWDNLLMEKRGNEYHLYIMEIPVINLPNSSTVIHFLWFSHNQAKNEGCFGKFIIFLSWVHELALSCGSSGLGHNIKHCLVIWKQAGRGKYFQRRWSLPPAQDKRNLAKLSALLFPKVAKTGFSFFFIKIVKANMPPFTKGN